MIVLSLRHAYAASSAFVALWALSPVIMGWLARMDASPTGRSLTHQDALYLRRLSRKTWRFFDDLVGPGSNWLPPDNSQLSLNVEVAARTSPTNIGLWLTSALAARDLGYLTADDLLARCSNTMATLNSLERYEGHLLNWYDTGNAGPVGAALRFHGGQRKSGRQPMGLGAGLPGCAQRSSDRPGLFARFVGHHFRTRGDVR